MTEIANVLRTSSTKRYTSQPHSPLFQRQLLFFNSVGISSSIVLEKMNLFLSPKDISVNEIEFFCIGSNMVLTRMDTTGQGAWRIQTPFATFLRLGVRRCVVSCWRPWPPSNLEGREMSACALGDQRETGEKDIGFWRWQLNTLSLGHFRFPDSIPHSVNSF